MRKAVTSTICLVILTFSLYAQEKGKDEPQWIPIDSTEKLTYFMNSRKIETSKGTIKAWVKVVPIEKDGKDFIVALYEYDCSQDASRAISVTVYKKDRKPESATLDEKWSNIMPDTLEYKLLKYACKE
jgi:hypothetical protein